MYENTALLILEILTKKGTAVLVFQKTLKFKVLKTVETFHDCHVKTCQYFKQRSVLEILDFFRGTDALSVGFKMKPLGQGDVPVKTKTNSNLAIKFVEMRKGKKVKSPCSNTCILS